MVNTLLYPIDSVSRRAVSLNGTWGIQFDPEGRGRSEGWMERLPSPDAIPVPASFADLYTDKATREYCGDFWYERDVFVPAEWKGRCVCVRFGSATHTAVVWCNGVEVGAHEGGFLPFSADITDVAVYGGMNHISVLVNNELSNTRMPCGAVKTLADGTKRAAPCFDFFNYSGLQRNVWLVALPTTRVEDYDLTYMIDGADAEVRYSVKTTGDARVSLQLLDQGGTLVAEAEGGEGALLVKDARLWRARDAYLYTLVLRLTDGNALVDEYRAPIGIRTVEIRDRKLLLNGEPVYLKGFGRHEDADIIGRGQSPAVLKRDFELMKWIGANSFRTSHYPYAEEVYQMADREGFLVVDEVQAVGCFPALMGFSADRSPFFSRPTVPQLLEHHLRSVEEMIRRDKNHPCVIAWSLLNEPETFNDAATPYFERVFDWARACDPQKRPRTFAMIQESAPSTCKCFHLSDFLSFNRYYGWYIQGGPDIVDAEAAFRAEMDAWAKVAPDKPILFTEYGADTHAAIDKLPSVMWSESYQIEMIAMCERVFDSYDAVIGEQVWNFADFQTTEGIIRVDGNKKGVFTRQRQPKRAAFHLRDRWMNMPDKWGK